MTTRPDEAGSMLVELLVGMILMSIIGMIVLDGIVGGLKSHQQLQERGTALEDTRRAAQRVTRDIREAAEVLHASATELTVQWQSDAGTVVRTWDLDTPAKALMQTTTIAGGAAATTTVIGDLDTGTLPFTYLSVHDYVPAAASINATTCAISGTSPVSYSGECVGGVRLTLVREVANHTPVTVTTDVDLRNRG